MSSIITVERIGRFILYLWIRYVKRDPVCYGDVDLRYSDWVFLLIGICVVGIIVGGTLLYFYLAG